MLSPSGVKNRRSGQGPKFPFKRMNIPLATQEIQTVVVAFYEKAQNDVIIGYHFKHIKDFSLHIPRIITFWKFQLLGISPCEGEAPFHLISIHLPLKIKKGEVGRWALLFEETLQERSLKEISSEQWKQKIGHFRQVFLNYFQGHCLN